MKVSVIVPFYNAEPYIDACCEALLAQQFAAAEYEIIMIDNNSDDCSREIVGRYPRITLLQQRRQGAYAARNTGLRAASGEIVAHRSGLYSQSRLAPADRAGI